MQLCAPDGCPCRANTPSTRRSGGPHGLRRGALLSAMLAGLRDDGQPEEDGWPYLAATPLDPASWLPPTEVGPLFGRDGEKSGHVIDRIIAKLDQGRPVIILTMLSRSFYMPTTGIDYSGEDEAPDPNIRHAVIAVGHGRSMAKALLIRNSWGPRWGDDGYGWLTERFLIAALFTPRPR